MEAAVRRVWLAQLAFPLTHFGLFTLIAYISVYHLGHYEPKDGPDGSFQVLLYLNAFATAVASLLYSITFLTYVNLKWDRIKTISSFQISIPIIVCAFIQVGIFFPIDQTEYVPTLYLWLIVSPIILAAASLKFISGNEEYA